MNSNTSKALDAFIDDCLLGEDSLCNYKKDESNLDLVASSIIQGLWAIEEQEKLKGEIPYLLSLKQLQGSWNSDIEYDLAS